MKNIFITFVFFVCSLTSSHFAIGQTVVDVKPYIIPSKSSGELHSAITDALAVESQHTNERLFIIVRPGTGETRRVNLARLRGLKVYLSQKAYSSRKTVFAEGESVEGEGQIEYYLGSQLRLITFAPKNKIPNYTCCEDYVPPKKKLRRKKSKQ